MRVLRTLRQPRCGGSGERSSRKWSEKALGEVWGYSNKSWEETAISMIGGASLTGIACVYDEALGQNMSGFSMLGENIHEGLWDSGES